LPAMSKCCCVPKANELMDLNQDIGFQKDEPVVMWTPPGQTGLHGMGPCAKGVVRSAIDVLPP
jgi:hypothetical protein